MHQRTVAVAAFIAALAFTALSFPCLSDPQWRTTKASWYNPGKKMVTAHRTLPIGTKVEVVHGSKRIVVTVAGRGPFVRGRDLDLSRHAFGHLALPSRGVIHVKYRVLSKAAAKKKK
ncbi:MAG: septal ring lytic transglycosylase RlpA family protein [Abditibacteriales bacterium]|nr:septal ring lytic transglycosylase RlpA family protein [Abditibacteriales bacterium]